MKYLDGYVVRGPVSISYFLENYRDVAVKSQKLRPKSSSLYVSGQILYYTSYFHKPWRYVKADHVSYGPTEQGRERPLTLPWASHSSPVASIPAKRASAFLLGRWSLLGANSHDTLTKMCISWQGFARSSWKCLNRRLVIVFCGGVEMSTRTQQRKQRNGVWRSYRR